MSSISSWSQSWQNIIYGLSMEILLHAGLFREALLCAGDYLWRSYCVLAKASPFPGCSYHPSSLILTSSSYIQVFTRLAKPSKTFTYPGFKISSFLGTQSAQQATSENSKITKSPEVGAQWWSVGRMLTKRLSVRATLACCLRSGEVRPGQG